MKMPLVIVLIITGAFLTLVADVFLKKGGWHDWRYFTVGLVLYGLAAIPVAFAFKYSGFVSLVLAWESFLVIISVIAGSWYFQESFTFYRFISLVFALGAIIFAYK